MVCGGLAAAQASGGDRPPPNGIGVRGRHAEVLADEGLAQRRPGRTEFGRGGVEAAELFGEMEGAFGLGRGRPGSGWAASLAWRVPLVAAADLTGSVLAFQQLGELPGDHPLQTPANVTSALVRPAAGNRLVPSRLLKPIAPGDARNVSGTVAKDRGRR
jgi:hypothetical protein